jgi:hypothetical protein
MGDHALMKFGWNGVARRHKSLFVMRRTKVLEHGEGRDPSELAANRDAHISFAVNGPLLIKFNLILGIPWAFSGSFSIVKFF